MHHVACVLYQHCVYFWLFAGVLKGTELLALLKYTCDRFVKVRVSQQFSALKTFQTSNKLRAWGKRIHATATGGEIHCFSVSWSSLLTLSNRTFIKMVPLISLILSSIFPTVHNHEVVFKYTSNFTVRILPWCTVDLNLVSFINIYIFYRGRGVCSYTPYFQFPYLNILLVLKVVQGCMSPGWENLPTGTNSNVSRTCDGGEP